MNGFKSGLSRRMQEFLDYEKAAGYSEFTYLSRLRNLDAFLTDSYPQGNVLDKEMVLEWAVRRENESPSTFNNRCGFIRKFARYLASTGEQAYILPDKFCPSGSGFTPYIFSDAELTALFRSIDRLTDPDPFVPFVLSTAFRLIYTCGLRPNESRNLKRSNINLKTGEILITETKRHKERIVVMSQDMLELAGSYSFIRDAAYPDSIYFFPSPDGGTYPSAWYQKHLKKAFHEAHADISGDELPWVRVYDLRHRFASAVLMRWIDSGKDLYSRLPYLQSYMGHSRLSSTAYYIHLLSENLVRSAGIDWNVLETIIPEVELWEE